MNTFYTLFWEKPCNILHRRKYERWDEKRLRKGKYDGNKLTKIINITLLLSIQLNIYSIIMFSLHSHIYMCMYTKMFLYNILFIRIIKRYYKYRPIEETQSKKLLFL